MIEARSRKATQTGADLATTQGGSPARSRPERRRLGVAVLLLGPLSVALVPPLFLIGSDLTQQIFCSSLVVVGWAGICLSMMHGRPNPRAPDPAVCASCGYPRVTASGEQPAICPECGTKYE